MIEDLEACRTLLSRLSSHLTEWERKFVKDMQVRLERKRALTEAQQNNLDQIWEDVVINRAGGKLGSPIR